MSEAKPTPDSGQTTIAPDVLLNIAALTTLGVRGVSRMSPVAGGVNRILQRDRQNDGVKIEVEDGQVHVDIHVILDAEVNIREVSRNIQKEVARAITEMVGMAPGRINIHIEDIDYEPDSEEEE
jgi:uncharacterized alkaline shock family protein YloU